jgi:hypothetical protein
MWRDDDSVIHIVEPANGLMGCLPKPFHEEVCDNKRQWQTHSHTVSLFIELDTAAEVQAEEPQDILNEMSPKAGFQASFPFYTIPHFCKPLAVLTACLMLVSCSSTLKMEVKCSSKMSVDFQQTTQCYITEHRVRIANLAHSNVT